MIINIKEGKMKLNINELAQKRRELCSVINIVLRYENPDFFF